MAEIYPFDIESNDSENDEMENNRRLSRKKRNRDEKNSNEYNVLEMDKLHQYISPPSELIKGASRSNLTDNCDFDFILDKSKIRYNNNNKILMNINKNQEAYCHLCKKIKLLRKCFNSDCYCYYCQVCISKYEKNGKFFNICYSCQNACDCDNCKKEESIEDPSKLDDKNVIKIDEFLIQEVEEDEIGSEDEEIEEDDSNYDDEEEDSLQSNNKEKYLPIVSSINKLEQVIKDACILCNKRKGEFDDSSLFLSFKSIEDFINYMKYFFSDTNNKNDKDYEKSFLDYSNFYNKFYESCYSSTKYPFSSIKVICLNCLKKELKSNNGFYNLFNFFQTGKSSQDSKIDILSQMKEKNIVTSSLNEYNPKKPNQITNSFNQKFNSNNFNYLNSININQIINNNNNNNSMQKNESNCNKINKTNDSDNRLNNENPTKNNLNKETVSFESSQNLNTSYNVMSSDFINTQNGKNIDPTRNTSNLNENLNNVLEELRKQFFCIQYYSLIQKVFVCYIFKHVDLFIDQVSKSQNLGDTVINNLVISIQKMLSKFDPNSNEVKEIYQNLNEQINLLKTINACSVNLTQTLYQNFEGLKNNGSKLFKGMDPSFNSAFNNNIHTLFCKTNVNSNEKLINDKQNFDNIMNSLNTLNYNTSPSQLANLLNLNQSDSLEQLFNFNKSTTNIPDSGSNNFKNLNANQQFLLNNNSFQSQNFNQNNNCIKNPIFNNQLENMLNSNSSNLLNMLGSLNKNNFNLNASFPGLNNCNIQNYPNQNNIFSNNLNGSFNLDNPLLNNLLKMQLNPSQLGNLGLGLGGIPNFDNQSGGINLNGFLGMNMNIPGMPNLNGMNNINPKLLLESKLHYLF